MENIDKKNELIQKYSQRVQKIIHELEFLIDDRIRDIEVYWGDIIDKNGVETEGTKIMLSNESDESLLSCLSDELETKYTPQDIIREYHQVEAQIKDMMSRSVGLSHITDSYLKVLEYEKREARKALRSLTDDSDDDLKEYFKLL